MSSEFKVGHVYYATPAMQGLKREIVIPIGRTDENMQLALIKGLSSGRVSKIDGREFVKFDTDNGAYSASSVAEANASDVAIVNDILMRSEYVS